MERIKLLKINVMENGITRLQSQLMVGRDSADFILENDVLKAYGHGERGFDFYPTDIPYTIVEDRKDMVCQPL